MNHDFASSLTLIAPELVLTGAGLILLVWAAFFGDRHATGISIAAVAALAAAAALTSLAPADGGDIFAGLASSDAFSTFAHVLIYFAAAVAIIIAPRFFRAHTPGGHGLMRAEYPILIVFAALGMGLMVSATDLMTLYVGLEMNSLAAYVLASFIRTDTRSAEAGLKYFVLGALASGILLYGMSLLYGFSGTTGFAGIAAAMDADFSGGLVFGLVFVLAGLAFKISAVPFHMWTPDVYEGAPTPVTAFFASAPKVAAMALTVRVCIEAFGPTTFDWQQIVIFLALASTILGAVGAIGQRNIKRLLAYSSINNVGFALVGLAAGSQAGVAATMSYMAVYVVMTLGSFLCVLQLRDANGAYVEDIARMAGLGKARPGLVAALAIFMFSLAGIPPLFGFWPKFLVFDAAVRADLLPLAAIAAVSSVISAFYYLKVIKTMYFDEAGDDAPDWDRASHPVESGLIGFTAAIVSPLGYLAIPALAFVSGNAALALFP
ncbi:MAG: NADH-quinone oxidoreductase subunit NuoN [Sphingomonadales bacterium]|nr:NADH-quinone oxidoreductase subunit NuoN [Sphingomonadales bacterium]